MNRTLIESLIKKHEGLRLTAYLDTVGKMTIGYGCNLDAPDSPVACVNAGIDYHAVTDGSAITEQQASDLLDYQLNKVLGQATHIFENFSTMPDAVQAVICDLIFNLGYNGFLNFPRALAAFKAGEWKEAAAQLQNSRWFSQVKSRATEDIALLEAV